MSTFGSFEIGRRAIHAQQKAVQVTGQNIANANTQGYSRQMVHMAALFPPPLAGVATSPGYGVTIADIRRVKSEFYEDQIMKALTAQNYWEHLEQTLNGIEVIFQEPSETGINIYLNEFFDAWQEVSTNPESLAVRISLREQADTLTSVVRDIYQRLDELKFDGRKELEATIGQINALAVEITELNKKITFLQALGQRANELLDERDLRLQELSSLIDIRIMQKDNGSVEVLAGGRILLHDDSSFPLEMSLQPGADEIQILNSSGARLAVAGGTILGMLESYNRIIPHYQGALDEMVYHLVEEVNALHRSGLGLTGSTGFNFFSNFSEDPGETVEMQRIAARFSLDEQILEDLNYIAAAAPGEDDALSGPGNGMNALQIARLREKLVMGKGTSTFHDYFRGVIADLGVEGREAQRMQDSMSFVSEQMREQQEAVSGVSLDDELLNMVQYQHAYNAAARYLSILDEMLAVLINEMGA